MNDLENATKNDTKIMTIENLPKIFGQLAIYNHEKVIEKFDSIENVFAQGNDWFVNLISLKDGKSYLLSKSDKAKIKLEKLFAKSFDRDILTLNKFMLRKEIIAKAQREK